MTSGADLSVHARLARLFFDEARSVGAGRLVFRRGEQAFTAPVNSDAIERLLLAESPDKFKFQARSEGRWIDVTSYTAIRSGNKVIAAIRDGDIETAGALSPATVARAAASEPKVFAVALRGLYSQVFEQINKDANSAIAARTSRLLNKQHALSDDPRVGFIRATVDLYDVMIKRDLSSVLQGGPTERTVAAVKDHIERAGDRFERSEARVAAANVLGKLLSLHDRQAAAAQFATVREDDEHGLMEHFHLENGSKTYFSAAEVASSSSRAGEIRASIESLEAGLPRNSFGLLIGLDAAFYRTYAPLLRFYAQQLPDIDFNFLICGSRGEAEAAVADGTAYSDALARLNASGVPANMHHFRVPTPDFVKDRNTFYASARFFAIEMMLDRYPSAYLMDADLVTDVDPRPFFRRVEHLTFAAPSMRGFTALYPWRRFMAGNIAVSKNVLETAVVDDLQDYLAHGLQFVNSWTLDQNALTYAIERNRRHYTDLRPLGRPFHQPKFRIAWERRHREMTEAR